jgi:hypothetical protein
MGRDLIPGLPNTKQGCQPSHRNIRMLTDLEGCGNAVEMKEGETGKG